MIATEVSSPAASAAVPAIDAGIALHSPSTELMKLVNIHGVDNENWTDFNVIVDYLQKHLYDIIHEIHVTYDKLLIDDGNTQINCPPTATDNHVDTENSTTLLLRTLSEKDSNTGNGIVAKRGIKVYDCGIASSVPTSDGNNNDDDDVTTTSNKKEYHTILIREDIENASTNVNDLHPTFVEHSIKLIVPRNVVIQ